MNTTLVLCVLTQSVHLTCAVQLSLFHLSRQVVPCPLRQSENAQTVFIISFQVYFHVKLNFKNILQNTFFPRITFSFAIFKIYKGKTFLTQFSIFSSSENNFLAKFGSFFSVKLTLSLFI